MTDQALTDLDEFLNTGVVPICPNCNIAVTAVQISAEALATFDATLKGL